MVICNAILWPLVMLVSMYTRGWNYALLSDTHCIMIQRPWYMILITKVTI